MIIDKVSIPTKLAQFSDYWNPRIVGELNNQHVKIVKFKGEFIWHHHEQEDELFLVLEGEFDMEFRDKTIHLKKDDFIIVPKGVEHRPVALGEVSVLLFEPATTLNTGNKIGDLTQSNLERL